MGRCGASPSLPLRTIVAVAGAFDDPLPPDAGNLVDDLARWLAENRTDDAARTRARERWLRQQAEEEGTFGGVLLDLAERGSALVAHGVAERRHRGHLRAVAADFCVLRTVAGTDVLLAYRALAIVRPQPREATVVGDRVLTTERSLADALVGLAADRPRVLVVTVGGDSVTGDLRAVGTDVITVRTDGEGRGDVYVALSAVAEVSLA